MNKSLYENEKLAFRLDFAPEIYGGLSMPEMLLVGKVSVIISLVVSLLISTCLAIIFSRYIILFAAIPFTAILTLVMASRLMGMFKALKDGRPDGYHVQYFQLYVQSLTAKFGVSETFVTRTGYWGIVRYE